MCFNQETRFFLKKKKKQRPLVSCLRITTLKEIVSQQKTEMNHQEEENVEKQIQNYFVSFFYFPKLFGI